jgi:hypothetical protein
MGNINVIFNAALNIGKTGEVWVPSNEIFAFSEIGDH